MAQGETTPGLSGTGFEPASRGKRSPWEKSSITLYFIGIPGSWMPLVVRIWK
jgi:hypothetical protein